MLMLVLYTLACVALFVLRKKLGLFWSATIFFVATYAYLALGITPPAPAAVLNMYAALALCGMLLYVTSSEEALDSVAEAGAEVDATQLRFDPSDLWECWTTLRHSGRANMLDFYNNPQTKALLKPELIWEIEQGMAMTDADVERAQGIRTRWLAELDRLFGDYDFLVLPTAQVFPFSKDVHWPKYIGLREMDTYHRWMEVVILGSLGGLPIINVPVGFDAGGRPMGMQVMGRYGDDKRVLEFGLAYEQRNDFLGQRPALG